MSASILKPTWTARKMIQAALGALAIALIAVSVFPNLAHAYEYRGRNLPGGAWTSGNGTFVTGMTGIWGEGSTPSSVCVSPVTHDAGGYHVPYGWHCAPNHISFNFPAITAAVGFYNPNPGTIAEYGAIGN
jgi:hypothetical protein